LGNKIYARMSLIDYRTLLDQITTNAAMGAYLTFVGNRKANARTGARLDENYAPRAAAAVHVRAL
jgi:uncharacterized protein (DUF1800 family)